MTAKISAKDALMEAIRREAEGRALYLALAARVKNPLVKRRLLGLADDELEHRETLSRMYWAQTGADPGPVEAASGAGIPGIETMSLEALLELAMKAERQASETYARLAAETSDPRAQAFLEYLSEFESGHQQTLQAELDRIRKDPAWVDSGPGGE